MYLFFNAEIEVFKKQMLNGCLATAMGFSSGQGWGLFADPATISLRGGTLQRRAVWGLAVRDGDVDFLADGHVTAGDYHSGLFFLGNVTVSI